MQYTSISKNTTLKQLSNQVGSRNLPYILNANALTREPAIGEQFNDKINEVYNDRTIPKVSSQRKLTLLNGMVDNSDVFEYAALLSEPGWKVLDKLNTFPGMLYVPDTVQIPSSESTLGNAEPVKTEIYSKVSQCLTADKPIDPTIFNEYNSQEFAAVVNQKDYSGPMQWFKIPWGEITLNSSIEDESVDFPVYPETITDRRIANFDTMPDLLYQYEPWQLYRGSGPRTIPYTFDMHRDMWSGDHRDGKCLDLIDFCFANLYPEFKGAAVNVPTVSLYIAGKLEITGILTDVSVEWDGDGPIGLDGWYLHCKVTLTITEVAREALNYHSVRSKVRSI